MEIQMNESSTDPSQYSTVTIRWEGWKELWKLAGQQIDPERAEVICRWGYVVDPYGVCPELAAEEECVGRIWFARNPDGNVWIEFGDLPERTARALWKKAVNLSAETLIDYAIPF
jgi:hypothetical protein